MALRTDLTDTTSAAGTHADQHNQANAAVLTLQAQVAALIAGEGGGGAAAPVITMQPSNQSVPPGTNASFAATASGVPTPTVQWYQAASTGAFSAITGATTTTLALSSVTTGQSGNRYYAIFTNNQGTAQTNTVTLTVSSTVISPAITTQPNNQSAIAGANATFTVAATGSPTPTVQWYQSTNGGASFNPISGATAYSLVITSTTTGQNGFQYYAILTNSGGSVQTNTVTLNVGPSTFAPTITTQPTNHTVTAGQDATFTAGASGTPTPTVQWQVSTDSGTTWTNISGATSNSYDAGNVTTAQNLNQYRAIYTNSAGTATTNVVTLTVNSAGGAPTLTQQPVNQSVVSGNSATFTAAATGTPSPTVQWYSSTDGVTFTVISGATSPSYTISTVTSGQNNNRYHAVFTNSNGSAQTNNATLTVVIYALVNEQQAAPTPSVGWTHNLNAGDGALVVAVGANTGGLLTSIESDNNITYTKVGTWTEGDRIVEIWLHTALTSYEGSTWATTSSGGFSTQIWMYVFNGTLSVPVMHTGDTSIGPFTVPQNSLVMVGAGTDTGSPTLPPGFTAGNAGTVAGTATAWRIVAPTESETLVVNSVAALAGVFLIGAPAMVDQPSSCAVSVGNTATFSASAVGTPTPSCQWQSSTDGGTTWNSVSGATSFYLTVPSMTLAASGTKYRAVFVNASGSITSDVATVTVTAVGTGGSGIVTLIDQAGNSSGLNANPGVATFSPSVGDSIVLGLTTPNSYGPTLGESVTASNGDIFVRVGTYDPNPSGTPSVVELWYCGHSAGGTGVTYTVVPTPNTYNWSYGYWWMHFNGSLSSPYYTFGQGSVAAFTPRANSLVTFICIAPLNWPPAGYTEATSGITGAHFAYSTYTTSPGAINLNQQGGGTELAVCFDTT